MVVNWVLLHWNHHVGSMEASLYLSLTCANLRARTLLCPTSQSSSELGAKGVLSKVSAVGSRARLSPVHTPAGPAVRQFQIGIVTSVKNNCSQNK